jgi:hypothetical protein
MRLAAQTHRTLHELGEQMTAEEFGLWQAYLQEEPLPPAHTAALAELIAAAANGKIPPPRGRWWSALDFMPKRWTGKPKPAPGSPAPKPSSTGGANSAAALRAFLGPRR